MAIQHVKGDFFDHEFGAQHRDFGFRDSAPSAPIGRHNRHPDRPTEHDKIMDHYAEGGEVRSEHAMHGEHHPHGHHVVHIEHKPDGRTIQHHAHGGHTVHHPHGAVSHHHHDGSPVHAAHGGFAHDAEAEYVHRPENEHLIHGREHRRHGGPMLHEGHPERGEMEREGDAHGGRANGRRHRAEGGRAGRHHEDGDEAQDKRMIKKAFHEHDEELHHGEHTDLHLARGGFAGRRVRLPRDMTPAGERPHSPINMPPRNPNVTSTPTNSMPGGEMPYGVQPSSEPAMAGGDGQAQMHRGGRTR